MAIPSRHVQWRIAYEVLYIYTDTPRNQRLDLFGVAFLGSLV
jgi:hypothetical protein